MWDAGATAAGWHAILNFTESCCGRRAGPRTLVRHVAQTVLRFGVSGLGTEVRGVGLGVQRFYEKFFGASKATVRPLYCCTSGWCRELS